MFVFRKIKSIECFYFREYNRNDFRSILYKNFFQKWRWLAIAVRRRGLKGRGRKTQFRRSKKNRPKKELRCQASPIGQFQSELRDARDRNKCGRMCGIPLQEGRGDWGLALSSRHRKGAAAKGWMEVGKGSLKNNVWSYKVWELGNRSL